MKRIALLLAMVCAMNAYSQNTVNNYKYVLVPEKFSILKQENQYGMNTLTRFLLDSVGFQTVMPGDEQPADLVNNKCAALKAELVEKKKFLATDLSLVLTDCQGNVVYKSDEGVSREKEWNLAYQEALRKAVASMKNLNYHYEGTGAIAASQTPAASVSAVSSVAAPALPAATPASATENKDVLYAQATANGYQLIDTSPKKVMTLLKTSSSDNFIADNGTDHGVVFRKSNEWYFEYYKNDQLVSVKLNIKF
jgi:hypothetical protein